MSNLVDRTVEHIYYIMVGENYLAELDARRGKVILATNRDKATKFHSDSLEPNEEKDIAKWASSIVSTLNTMNFKDIKVIKVKRVKITQEDDYEMKFIHVGADIKLKHWSDES